MNHAQSHKSPSQYQSFQVVCIQKGQLSSLDIQAVEIQPADKRARDAVQLEAVPEMGPWTANGASSIKAVAPGDLSRMAVAAPIDFAAVKRLTNLNDIVRALHETHARERSIEGELEQLLSKRSDIEKSFLRLHSTASEVVGRGCCSYSSVIHHLMHI